MFSVVLTKHYFQAKVVHVAIMQQAVTRIPEALEFHMSQKKKKKFFASA